MELLNLESKNLIIRNLKPTDLSNFLVYRSNPKVTLYQGFDVMNKEQASNFIKGQENKRFGKPGEWVQYGIEEKEGKQLIGDCAIRFQEVDPRIAEIGITISHLHQRKGFAKEAMRCILSFLFEKKIIHRVVETVDAENISSIKLLESIGFRKEEHFIENIFFNGKWGSEYQYVMLRKEWEKLNPI